MSDTDLIRAERGGEVLVRYRDTGDGVHAQEVEVPAYIWRFDPDMDDPQYMGHARPGTTDADAGWAIRQITSNHTIKWADGDSLMNNVWDDRAALTYA